MTRYWRNWTAWRPLLSEGVLCPNCGQRVPLVYFGEHAIEHEDEYFEGVWKPGEKQVARGRPRG